MEKKVGIVDETGIFRVLSESEVRDYLSEAMM